MTRSLRPAILVWLLLAGVSLSLLLRAWLTPPPGTAFIGTFYYTDDFFNYLTMVEQAQRGEFVFRSKLASPSLPAALVNLEWLLAGWLAALLGGRTVLAFRLFGLLAIGGWVYAADRYLLRSGLGDRHRLPALLLVFTGGGVGGLLWAVGRLRGDRAFDLVTGAYPFVASVANPHFVAGSALLLGALAAFASGRTACGAALGAVLSFVRPYDAALLATIEGANALLCDRGRTRLRRLWPVAAVLPGLAWTWFVITASPGFGAFGSTLYAENSPTLLELAIALGPAGLLALSSLPARGHAGIEPGHLRRLVFWALIATSVVMLRPVSYSLQFIVGAGFPVLALAAIGLSRVGHRTLVAAIPLMATSSAVVVWLCTIPSPRTHPPLQWWLVPQALRHDCRPGELVLAPAPIGLYVGGLTPCWPFVSYASAADYQARLQQVTRFYDPRTSPQERRQLLDTYDPAYLVLPPILPPDALGPDRPYLVRHIVRGPAGALAIWSRNPAPPPLPPPAH